MCLLLREKNKLCSFLMLLFNPFFFPSFPSVNLTQFSQVSSGRKKKINCTLFGMKLRKIRLEFFFSSFGFVLTKTSVSVPRQTKTAELAKAINWTGPFYLEKILKHPSATELALVAGSSATINGKSGKVHYHSSAVITTGFHWAAESGKWHWGEQRKMAHSEQGKGSFTQKNLETH